MDVFYLVCGMCGHADTLQGFELFGRMSRVRVLQCMPHPANGQGHTFLVDKPVVIGEPMSDIMLPTHGELYVRAVTEIADLRAERDKYAAEVERLQVAWEKVLEGVAMLTAEALNDE